MPLIPVGTDQLIQQFILDELISTAADQAAQDASVNFFPVKNRILPFDIGVDAFPMVNVWIDRIEPNSETSSAKFHLQESATFNLDMYTKGDVSQTELPGQNAVERLLYLKDQVKFVILSLINIDFGLGAGCVATRKWPRFQNFKPDLADGESTIPAGRWTFEIEYSFTPDDHDLVDLKKINVDTELWSAFFQF